MTLPAPATIGETLDTLGPGPVARFDRGSSVTVKLYSGQLAAVGDALALQGRSTMAIQGSDGAWEIFAFSDAELVANDTYRLSRLLRGLGGDEALATRSVPAGASVVLLDRAVMPLASGLSSIGATNALSVGPANGVAGGATYASLSATVTTKALHPYSPVQATAIQGAAGVLISFIRRGRIDSDAWEPIDIPLGEDSESYQISIARPGGDAADSAGDVAIRAVRGKRHGRGFRDAARGARSHDPADQRRGRRGISPLRPRPHPVRRHVRFQQACAAAHRRGAIAEARHAQ